MIRTFLAITPSTEIIADVGEFQALLRETGADVRWVDPAAMHWTIQFLGEVRDEEVPEIERKLAESLGEQAPIDLEYRGVGAFPNLKRPRVLWVGLQGAGLARLVERVEIALSPLGFPPENRELRPHITLGRVRSLRGSERIAAIARDSADRGFGACRIEQAILYRSQLRPTGAVYTPLATFPFKGSTGSGGR